MSWSPDAQGLPDRVPVLGRRLGGRGQRDGQQAEAGRATGPGRCAYHGACPALAKPRFSMDPHSFLPFR
ncbi:MAG: hypothetical protein MZV64_43930 [Ignavibacteriales bacterium]|nr:hypothetical protein [Ignavibacteriales bacterium]